MVREHGLLFVCEVGAALILFHRNLEAFWTLLAINW